LRTHADYVRLFSARDLLFEPGARHEYSNYGFILLGAVIEAVTETSYTTPWMNSSTSRRE
jgi:CubicO group peptidase (beta-lactamase class C family)